MFYDIEIFGPEEASSDDFNNAGREAVARAGYQVGDLNITSKGPTGREQMIVSGSLDITIPTVQTKSPVNRSFEWNDFLVRVGQFTD